ncbi:hypothetical protein L1987_24891 [Smallanthus sonchifolius]|uniref:Uncharacterized protein n=1 Tax=Smallanthus sonchifolius TaxID=185202 RepID=A0ACB9IL18_9ASTR|nr:hypothetical protein L1987_24891 [Smallanthus sonchifolius]
MEMSGATPDPVVHGGNGMFKDVLLGNRFSKDIISEISLKIHETAAMKFWNDVSLLGVATSLSALIELKQSLEGIFDLQVALRYVGGLRFLLTFPTHQEALDFLKEKESVWKSWCTSLVIWRGQNYVFERIAWIRIFGVPPHLWEDGVFDTIASNFGRVMQSSDASTREGNLAFDTVAIMVDHGLTVNREAKIMWKGTRIRCWIREVNDDWVPWESPIHADSTATQHHLDPMIEVINVPTSPVATQGDMGNYVGPILEDLTIKVSGGSRFRKRPRVESDVGSFSQPICPTLPVSPSAFPNPFVSQQSTRPTRTLKAVHRRKDTSFPASSPVVDVEDGSLFAFNSSVSHVVDNNPSTQVDDPSNLDSFLEVEVQNKLHIGECVGLDMSNCESRMKEVIIGEAVDTVRQ